MKYTFKAAALASAIALSAPMAFAEEKANPFSDVRVRQAIAYAIDMETIAETLFEGKAIVADSMIPNGAWKTDGLNAYGYDPDKARALLEEAGWDEDYAVDVVFYYGDQITLDLMTVLQSYLADVGVQMTYRKLEGDPALLTAVAEPDAESSVVAWDMAYGAKAALVMQEYYSVYADGQSAYTPGNATRNELLDRINGTTDIEEQKAAFADFQRFENTELSDIPLYYQQLYIFESDRVNRNGGLYGNDQFNYDWGILNWEVEPDKNGKRILYTNKGPIQVFFIPWLNPGLQIASKIMFDRLLTADGSLVPTGGQLAESWDVSADGLTVTFNMRDDATWHDGQPLTAEDVAWSIETAIKVPLVNAVLANTFTSIEGADAFKAGDAESVSGITVDGNTLTLKFATIDPSVLVTFTQFAPLPKHLLEDVDPLEFQQDAYWQAPVGSGAFRIEEVQMNDFTRFVPYENYYGGIAKIDEIVAFPSEDVDPNAVKNAAAGRLDFGFTKSVADVQALEDMPHMRVVGADIPYTRSLRVNAYSMRPVN